MIPQNAYTATSKLQSMFPTSGIELLNLINLVTCMAHIVQLALCAILSSLGVERQTKYWETHVCEQQIEENEYIDIGKSQRLGIEDNCSISKVSAMRPGLGKIIENVRISRYFESPETALYVAQNACNIDDAVTWW